MTDQTPKPAETPKLKDARQNPWYVLMTVAGEQREDANIVIYDRDLHAKNRRLFNGWMAAGLNDEAKARLIEPGWAKAEDFEDGGPLSPLTTEEHATIRAAWADRCPEAEPPDKSTFSVKLAASDLSGSLICNGFLFSGAADFQRSTFSDDANFQHTTFSGGATFLGTTFSGTADFEGTTFSGRATFRGTTFSRDAFFSGTTFSGTANFEGTTFSGGASFQHTTFSRDAFFSGTTFSGGANFRGTTFSRTANFRGTTFSGTADYSDAMFKARTLFSPIRKEDAPDRPVIFKTEPPRFFNADLHEDTDFTDVVWPPVPDTREKAIEHRRAYERLKLLMDSQKKTADEHMFHRLEMRCREVELVHAEDRNWEKWGTLQAHRAFSWLSDYGWDLGRPAAGLGILVAVGWVAIFVSEFASDKWWGTADALGVGQSLALSLSNVFGFLGLSRTFLREELQDLTTLSEIVSGTQTILGLILFFLLGLALRNRFRLK